MALLPFDEARARVRSRVRMLPSEIVALEASLGRVLSEPILARRDWPRADNSAMDGYAVRAAELTGAAADRAVELCLVGVSRAGHPARVEVGEGQAVRIFTGALVPAGADAVVMQEDTDRAGPERVRVRVSVAQGRHIRRAAEEYRASDVLLPRGARLNGPGIGLLAGDGHLRVAVYRRPRVSILATGDELASPGRVEPPPEAVVDGNGPMLAAMVQEAGGVVLRAERRSDSVAEVSSWLRLACDEADVVLSTGGASVGEHDVIAAAWEEAGIETDFWKVAMKPGKPLRFGTRPRSEGRVTLVFALPGNPLSALTGFEHFVRPVLRELAGGLWREPPALRMPAPAPLSNRGDRRVFLRAGVEASGGEARLAIPPRQGSNMLREAALRSAVAVLPPGPVEVAAGGLVEVLVDGDMLAGLRLELSRDGS